MITENSGPKPVVASENSGPKNAHSIDHPISFWMPISYGCTGFLIGFTTGLSNTPVVKELLPLLFGLISGGAGFFAVSKARYSRKIGLCLTSLTLMAVLGVVQGIVVRLGSSWANFWNPHATVDIPFAAQDSVTKYAALVALRTHLEDLNLSAKEQRFILQKASREDEKNIQTAIESLAGTVYEEYLPNINQPEEKEKYKNNPISSTGNSVEKQEQKNTASGVEPSGDKIKVIPPPGWKIPGNPLADVQDKSLQSQINALNKIVKQNQDQKIQY